MSGLMIPKHVARAAMAKASPAPSSPIIISTASSDDNSVTIYSVDRALPEVVPKSVHPYRLYVMLVGLRNKIGSIALPDETIDAQYFNHCLGRIVAMGPCCFKGQRWRDIDYTPDMAPKVGDYITFNPRAPIREVWSNTTLIVMNDDDWRSSPTRDEINHLQAWAGY